MSQREEIKVFSYLKISPLRQKEVMLMIVDSSISMGHLVDTILCAEAAL